MSSYWKIAVVTQLIVAVALGVLVPVVTSFFLLILSTPMTGKAAEEYRDKIKADFAKWVIKAICFFIVVLALADGVVLAAPHLWAGYVRILDWLDVQVVFTFIALGVVGIGFGAFKFKENYKKWYGVVEIVFSFVSVVVALMTTKPDNRTGLVVTIIGAMYVSSRGFGNWLGKKD